MADTVLDSTPPITGVARRDCICPQSYASNIPPPDYDGIAIFKVGALPRTTACLSKLSILYAIAFCVNHWGISFVVRTGFEPVFADLFKPVITITPPDYFVEKGGLEPPSR